jgi:hypothetical protein
LLQSLVIVTGNDHFRKLDYINGSDAPGEGTGDSGGSNHERKKSPTRVALGPRTSHGANDDGPNNQVFITVFPNGDVQHNGLKLTVTVGKNVEMDKVIGLSSPFFFIRFSFISHSKALCSLYLQICGQIQHDMELISGPIRKLYTIPGGKRVTSSEQLEASGFYAASSATDPYLKVKYRLNGDTDGAADGAPSTVQAEAVSKKRSELRKRKEEAQREKKETQEAHKESAQEAKQVKAAKKLEKKEAADKAREAAAADKKSNKSKAPSAAPSVALSVASEASKRKSSVKPPKVEAVDDKAPASVEDEIPVEPGAEPEPEPEALQGAPKTVEDEEAAGQLDAEENAEEAAAAEDEDDDGEIEAEEPADEDLDEEGAEIDEDAIELDDEAPENAAEVSAPADDEGPEEVELGV